MFVSRLKGTDLKTQVKDEIMRYIKMMDLKVDNKLPREEDFAKIIGTSRITLRAVLDELAADCIIFRKHGRGTFVNATSIGIKITFNPVQDFYKIIENSGFKPSMEVIFCGYRPITNALADALNMPHSSKAMVIKKIFYADRHFCAYIVDYLNTDGLNKDILSENDFHNPIFIMLKSKFDIKITWDLVEISVAMSAEVSDLGPLIDKGVCKDKPLLVLKGVNYDSNNRPILYGWEYIDTDVIKFNQIRKRQ